MKKMLLLPLIAVAGLVSQGWAAWTPCATPTEHCLYDSGDCWAINKGENDDKNCASEVSNCERNGWVFTGVPSSGEGTGKLCAGGTFQTGRGVDNSPITTVPVGDFGCCDWDNNGCFKIPTQAKRDDCPTANWYASCPNDANGTCPNSQNNQNNQNNNNNNNSPIIAGVSMANLTVLAQHGSLHISSMSEASVSLFDMTGKQVFSQKVPSGYSTLNLAGHKQGIYLAVVSSGSSKQTVRVVLK